MNKARFTLIAGGAGALLLLLVIGAPEEYAELESFDEESYSGSFGSGSESLLIEDSSYPDDPYYPDNPYLEEPLNEFELCVLNVLDPEPFCTDLDNPDECGPLEDEFGEPFISDDELIAICVGEDAAPFLGEEEEQALRERIEKIRGVLKNIAAAKASGKSLAEVVLPGPYADGEQDALRHIVGSAILYNATTPFLRGGVLPVLNAREDASTPAGAMDINNNTIGVSLAKAAPEGADWLCHIVIEALKKIKNGDATVVTSNEQQKAKVEYWLSHLDELKALLGCPEEEPSPEPESSPEPSPEPSPNPEPSPEPTPEPTGGSTSSSTTSSSTTSSSTTSSSTTSSSTTSSTTSSSSTTS